MECMELKDTIKTLNGVIETLKDGQHGYRVASEDVKDAELKSLFASYSLQRSNFRGGVAERIDSPGGVIGAGRGSSTVTSALHRGMDQPEERAERGWTRGHPQRVRAGG